MNEKQAAALCGIKPSLLRYYRDRGILPASADEYPDTVAAEYQTLSVLLDAGFSEGEILSMRQDPATIGENCATLFARRDDFPALRAVLHRIALQPELVPRDVSALSDFLSPTLQKAPAKEKSALRSDRRSTRILGAVFYAAVSLFLLCESGLALWLRSSFWQLPVYFILLTVLFFGVEWVRFVTVSATFFDVGILVLTWDHLGGAARDGGYLPWILLSLFLLILSDVILLLSADLQFFFYRRRNR